MKQSSNWLLVIQDHKKTKSLKWRFLKLLINKVLLTYLMLRESQPLLQISRAIVPHIRAAVPHLRAAVSRLYSQQ